MSKVNGSSLLPETDIEDTYDELIGNLSSNMKTVMNDLLKYFQQQWFLKVLISQWSVHGLCITTNNNAEAFHSRFNRRVSKHLVVQQILAKEGRFHHIHIQFSGGLGAKAQQAKTIDIQRCIEHFTKRYYDGLMNVMEYLDDLPLIVAKQKN